MLDLKKTLPSHNACNGQSEMNVEVYHEKVLERDVVTQPVAIIRWGGGCIFITIKDRTQLSAPGR